MEKSEIYINISILNDTNFHGSIKQRATTELGKEARVRDTVMRTL